MSGSERLERGFFEFFEFLNLILRIVKSSFNFNFPMLKFDFEFFSDFEI